MCGSTGRVQATPNWRILCERSDTFDAQLLGGISAAAVTVLTILVITDLTTGTGRFNLVRGAVGTLIAIAASISTTASGFIFEGLGHWEGFLILAAASAIATALLWAAMSRDNTG